MGFFDWLWGYEDENLYFPWRQPPPIPQVSVGADRDEGRHETDTEINHLSDQPQ
jgi:hypothetical protein